MPDQLELLEDLRSKDRWALVILDACRHDALEHLLDRAITRTESPATNTQEWVKAAWPDYYDDVTYVSSIPFIGRDEIKGYRARDHFGAVIEAFDEQHNFDLGTTPPGAVVDAAKDHVHRPGLIVHFAQPHAPYIGEPRLVEVDLLADHQRQGIERQGTLGIIRQKVEAGELSLDRVREAYLGNLYHVWSQGVIDLLLKLDDGRDVVVTADHGECLGEHKIGHNNDCAHVREVPWEPMGEVITRGG